MTSLNRQLSRLVAAGAVLTAVAVTVIALHASNSPSVERFIACVNEKRFLVTSERRSGHRTIDTIADRARNVAVGELTVFSSQRAAESFPVDTTRFPGTGESNGRMVLLTRSVSGRDWRAILACAAPEFPGP